MPDETPPRSERVILVVEDDAETGKAMVRIIRNRGFLVLKAGSIAEARQLAAQNTIHLLISDLGLPDGDGCTLMTELAAKFRIKGVAVSGYGMQADIDRCVGAGFAMHKTKPITADVLVEILKLADG